jgi:hypothetical protein
MENAPAGDQYEKLSLVRICMHPVHVSCWGDRCNHCKIDHCPRNALLPRVDIGFDPVMEREMIDGMNRFLARFDSERSQCSLVHLVSCFAAQIELIEIRLRSHPESMDRELFEALLQNYYLCIWHTRRKESGFIFEGDHPELSPLVHAILIVMAGSVPISRMAPTFAAALSPLETFIFLRRMALFQHFALDQPLARGRNLDWESILSYESLCKRYSVSKHEFDEYLPRFQLITLPENFFGFMLEPFRFDIANNCEFEVAFCLLTGRQLIIPNPLVIVRNTKSLNDILSDPLRDTYSFFLAVSGARAGRVFVSDGEFKWFSDLKSCYVDHYGQENREFRSGGLLTLCHHRLAVLTDLMISGGWTDAMSIAAVP